MKTFDTATCYTDLVLSNILYLRGLLPSTPIHCAPLDPESALILEELVALCAGAGVVTTGSQPALPAEEQKEFVMGMWKGRLADFEDALCDLDLDYLACQHGPTWAEEAVMSDKLYEYDVNFISVTPANLTGMYVSDYPSIARDDAGGYDTEAYSVSKDPSIVSFYVCDPEFDRPTGQCLRLLTQALKSINK